MQIKTKHTIAPDIETDRLRLRSYRQTDIEPLYKMAQCPETNRYLGKPAVNKEEVWRKVLAAIGSWAHYGFGYWVIEEKETSQFVGHTGFSNFNRDLPKAVKSLPEIGWVLALPKQGHGFAIEAAQKISNWADENMDEKETFCMIAPENTKSIRLAETLGYEYYSKEKYKDDDVNLFIRNSTMGKN